MNRVLITGGAGYIGSVLVGDLLAKGYLVTVLDNFLYQKNSLALYYANSAFNVINCDVRNTLKVDSIINQTFSVANFIKSSKASIARNNMCRQLIKAQQLNFD